MRKRAFIAAACTVFVFFWAATAVIQISGCGGGGGGTPTGTLQAQITDAPPSASASFASVHITIDKVVAVPAGREAADDNDSGLPVVASFPGRLGIDILNLHFVPQVLGTATLPAGSYTQLRLILAPNAGGTNNYVTLTGNPNQKIPLTTPSAQQTGLKISGNFTVAAGTLNTIVIDFNPNTAIVFAGNSGNVILKPTGIRIIQVFSALTNAGSVSGEIRSAPFRRWSSATVSVLPRNPAGSAVSTGVVFSNFSSPSVYKAPFNAFLPPNGSGAVPSAHYKLFVQAITTPTVAAFNLYSSPLFTVTSGADTPVPPNGVVPLTP